MNLQLREAIINRLQHKSINELRQVIDDSIGGEERILPGLGVILEMVWEDIHEDIKNQIVHALHGHVLSRLASKASS